MSILFDQLVYIDTETESESSAHGRAIEFENGDEEIPANIQPGKSADGEEHGAQRDVVPFIMHFPIDAAVTPKAGRRVRWTDASGQVWRITIDSADDLAGRGVMYRATGNGRIYAA